MQDQALLIGYLTLLSLKHLNLKVELVDLFPHSPYVTLRFEKTAQLQPPVIDLLKETLRGVIKKGEYHLSEMVPSVAMDYAEHKGSPIDVDLDESTVWLIEAFGEIYPIEEPYFGEELKQGLGFDVLEVSHHEEFTDLTLGFDSDIKSLKKKFQAASEFKCAKFLQKAGVLSEDHQPLERALDLLRYFKELVLGHSLVLPEEISTEESFLLDPFVYPRVLMDGVKINFNSAGSEGSLIYHLKSLIKIPKILEFSFYSILEGKWKACDLGSLFDGATSVTERNGDSRRVEIGVNDPYGRQLPIIEIFISKKKLLVSVDVGMLFTAHLLVHHSVYPRNLPKPWQVAILGEEKIVEELQDAKMRARLKGASAFCVKMSDKQLASSAGPLQVDQCFWWDGVKQALCSQSFTKDESR